MMKKRTLAAALAALTLTGTVLSACDNTGTGTETNSGTSIGTTTEAPETQAETEAVLSNDPLDYEDPNWSEDALLVNVDSNWPNKISSSSVEEAVASAENFALKYTGANVSDVLICIFEQTSLVPSDTQMWRATKYNMTEENGIPVDYSSLEGLYKVYTEYDVDPYAIMLQTLRENGIRPWVTLRMNDCHFGADETSFLRSDYYYEAKEKGYMISSAGTDYGYFNTCLDFGVAEVRERMLVYIEEVLSKYDMFGLELDFMRDITSFDYLNNPDCAQIMNDFMREVRKLTDAAAEKWGHSVKLMVRVGRSVEHDLIYGFDAATWVAEDLVDALVPSPRWGCTDSGIPVKEWKELVGEKSVAVFPCVECLHLEYTNTTVDHMRAYAAAWYAQDADGLYTYNFYGVSGTTWKEWNLSKDGCVESKRHFVVTYQDFYPQKTDPYEPLPINVGKMTASGEPLVLSVGKINASDTVTLTFSLGGPGDVPTVTINGVEPVQVEAISGDQIVAPAEDGSGDVQLTKFKTGYVCTFTGIETDCDISVFFEGVLGGKNGKIDYVDLWIEPETNQ